MFVVISPTLMPFVDSIFTEETSNLFKLTSFAKSFNLPFAVSFPSDVTLLAVIVISSPLVALLRVTLLSDAFKSNSFAVFASSIVIFPPASK